MAKSRTIRARKKKLDRLRNFLLGFLCCGSVPDQDELSDDIYVDKTEILCEGTPSPKLQNQKSCTTLPENPKRTLVGLAQVDNGLYIDERPLSERILDEMIMKIVGQSGGLGRSNEKPKVPLRPTVIQNTTQTDNDERNENKEFTRQILNAIIEATVRRNDSISHEKPPRPSAPKRKDKDVDANMHQENAKMMTQIIDGMIANVCLQPKKTPPPRPSLPNLRDLGIEDHRKDDKSLKSVHKQISERILDEIIMKFVRECGVSREKPARPPALKPDIIIHEKKNTEKKRQIMDGIVADVTCNHNCQLPEIPLRKSFSQVEIGKSNKEIPTRPNRPLSGRRWTSPAVKPMELPTPLLPVLEQTSTRVQKSKPPRPPPIQIRSNNGPTRSPKPNGPPVQRNSPIQSGSASSIRKVSSTIQQRPNESQKPVKPPRPKETSRPDNKHQLQIPQRQQIPPRPKNPLRPQLSLRQPTRPQMPTRPQLPQIPPIPQKPPRPKLSPRQQLPPGQQLPTRPKLPPKPQLPPRPELPPKPKLPPRPMKSPSSIMIRRPEMLLSEQNQQPKPDNKDCDIKKDRSRTYAPLSTDDYPEELNPFADDTDDEGSESNYETADSDINSDGEISDLYLDELNPFVDDCKLEDAEVKDIKSESIYNTESFDIKAYNGVNDEYPEELNPFAEDDNLEVAEVKESNQTKTMDDNPDELNPFAGDE